MMKVGKRQLALATMVVALGAAMYLNWTLSDGIPLQTAQTETVDDALGEKLVNAGLVSMVEANTSADPNAVEITAEADALAAAKTFSEARLARQQSRDEAIEVLENILEDANSDDAARQAAITRAAEIAQNILKETNMENLIRAKGCEECMVYLENGQCTVVVGNDFNEGEDLVVIRDIVMNQSGLPADAIRVVKAGG